MVFRSGEADHKFDCPDRQSTVQRDARMWERVKGMAVYQSVIVTCRDTGTIDVSARGICLRKGMRFVQSLR